MSNIFFSRYFDQGYWPGPLQDCQAAVGEHWVGPRGLLDRLETALGLRGPIEPEAVRVASLVPKLQSLAGFWSRSAGVDPFGTARMMLSWRDYLCLHGWRGEGKQPRLQMLAELTGEVVPGVPDRLMRVSDRLARHPAEIESLNIYEPLESFPLLWRKVMSGLRGQGTLLQQKDIIQAVAKGDLAGAKLGSFTPTGDGSLRLLQTPGPMSAAHEVAAWQCALDSLEGTVVISPAPVLDTALERFGLPTTGCSGATADDTLLQILPLVLKMAWQPPDPQKALDLLSLNVSPIPRGVRVRLASALQEWPAVGSQVWNRKLDEGLKAIPEKGRRQSIQERLQAIFGPCLSRGSYPAKEIHQRVKVLMDWGRGRLGTAEEDERPGWTAMLKQMENLTRLAQLCGLESLNAAQLRRAIHDSASEISLPPLSEAQAGVNIVKSPGSIVGPARRIIWWDFTLNGTNPPAPPPLTLAEKNELAEFGVALPEPGEEALLLSHSWRRPLQSAQKSLLMVCPARGDEGQEMFTHPVWDEIACSAGDGKYLLSGPNLKSCTAKEQRDSMTMPEPVTTWQGPLDTFNLRETESASSLQSLCGCPFQYLLQYWCKIRAAGGWSLPSQVQLEGLLMHEILSEVFMSWPMKPEQAAEEAEQLLMQRGPLLAANLFLPGMKAALAQTRRTLSGAVRVLVDHLTEAGLVPTETEESLEFEMPELGFSLYGRPDLVAQGTVIDFKRSGAGFWLDRLKNGSAVQLACYGRLLNPHKKDNRWPPAAIFILRDASMLSLDLKVFPTVDPVSGPSLAETWEGLVDLVENRKKELVRGEIQAIGLLEDCPESSCLAPEGLEVAPSCKYCDFGLLCGQGFGG
jgi:ATP-dependent helicase/nuclease subunit B